jgi:PTH2 family peptidyl-tRNA hydrolase
MDYNYKQVILVRTDLKLPKGKLAVQVAHASVEAVHRADKDIVKYWRSEGMKKVVLKVADLQELYAYEQEARKLNMTTAVITDAGHTTVAPGTTTCVAIGPDVEEKIDRITGKLKIL